MPTSPLAQYRKAIEQELALGQATEHTHRPALEELIESFGDDLNATNEPAHVECGAGVLAFITNHGYLDNPTFRGMRQSLRKTFDEIYILDLHGNTKKKEVCPDGSKDENVFDIQQGVAIAIMVKLPEK